jgi:hypothetical protein
MEEDLTQEEMEALEELGYGSPRPEEKQNIFSFFKRVIAMADTTRTSNLTEEELGLVKVPVRTNQFISLYAKQMGLKGLANHFFKESQIITNSSLSREGFLDKLAVTQKREMEARARSYKKQQPKGWFKKKQPEEEF